MSANVETMSYIGKVPWHGLGTEITETDQWDWPIVCQKSGLDWEAQLVPFVTEDTHKIVDHKAVRRVTDGRVLGVVGPRYTVLQNRQAFEWFQPFLAAKEAALHTAGSLAEGSRVWVLAKLQRDPFVIAAGDEVEKYVLLSHAHDGTLSLRIGFTPIRVVCANTLAMAHGDKASKLIRIKHSRSMQTNMANVRDIMNLANQEFEATAEQYKLLANKNINSSDLQKYIKKVLKVEEEEEVSTRTANQIDSIVGLFEGGMGNDLPSVKGTFWTAYNSITQWLSYERGGDQSRRLNSLWFGDSANMNAKALELALKMAS